VYLTSPLGAGIERYHGANQLRLIYLKGPLGNWREEKTDEKLRRSGLPQTSLVLEIGRHVKCMVSFLREKKWENDCLLSFRVTFILGEDCCNRQKRITSVRTEVFSSRQIPKGPFR
jgi:hypothetical protein